MLREELTSTLFIIIAQQWQKKCKYFVLISCFLRLCLIKNAQVSRRRFSVGIGIHKLIFFRQAFAFVWKKIKKKRFVTTLNYNLQKYICKIMEEKKRSPTEEDNDEEGRRSSRRKKAKVCPELTRLSLCCYKCNALCSNIFAFIIL